MQLIKILRPRCFSTMKIIQPNTHILILLALFFSVSIFIKIISLIALVIKIVKRW